MKKTALFILLIISGVVASAQTYPERTGWNHFVWGAEVGGSVDMTSNSMSTVNLDAFFGYKNSFIDALAVGASVNMVLSNSVRSFPVYMLLRTNFCNRPTFAFMDLRGGVVINNFGASRDQAGFYISPGVGFRLASGKTFTSYITVSYVYNGMRPYSRGDIHYDIDGLHMACMRLGISF
ncbi:MAG: hypothetical protein K2M94_02705 [Paramuribaculum sp.]|nr:hypothetical protein [Paramuribaculum sp.]